MPSTFTANLRVEKPASGEQIGTWGVTANRDFDLFDQAITGSASVILPAAGTSGAPNLLTMIDGALNDARAALVEFIDGGDLGSDAFVRLDPNNISKITMVRNGLTANRSLFLFQGTYDVSRRLEIRAGQIAVVRFSGAGTVSPVLDSLSGLQLASLLVLGGAVINGTTIPATSTLVTTAATQTLLAKTLQNYLITGSYTEQVFTITDGAAVDLDPANGTIQLWTLGANRSPTATNFLTGQSMTLLVNDGAARSITWPSVVWVGGTAPVLATTGLTLITLFKVGATLYGQLRGYVA
jgi:hypothetical protein